jgi:hypothetical protein
MVGTLRGTRRQRAFCRARVAVAATSIPARLMPSWVLAWRNSAHPPRPRDRAMSAAAGTVVTEMNTPTSAPLFAEVRESTPATPASTATTTDQWSGAVMKPVSGRSADSSSTPYQPSHRPISATAAVRPIATAKPATSATAALRAIRRRPWIRATARAARGANSGPSTIAPITRIAESLTIAIAARSVAIVRKAR